MQLHAADMRIYVCRISMHKALLHLSPNSNDTSHLSTGRAHTPVLGVEGGCTPLTPPPRSALAHTVQRVKVYAWRKSSVRRCSFCRTKKGLHATCVFGQRLLWLTGPLLTGARSTVAPADRCSCPVHTPPCPTCSKIAAHGMNSQIVAEPLGKPITFISMYTFFQQSINSVSTSYDACVIRLQGYNALLHLSSKSNDTSCFPICRAPVPVLGIESGCTPSYRAAHTVQCVQVYAWRKSCVHCCLFCSE